MTNRNAQWIRRLNDILLLTCVDPGDISQEQWSKVVGRLLSGRNKIKDLSVQTEVRGIKQELSARLKLLKFDKRPTATSFPIKGLRTIYIVEWVDGKFLTSYSGSDDVATAIYASFGYLLEAAEIGPDDIYVCDECRGFFIRLRKPSTNEKNVFCSKRCRGRVGSRNYRKTKGDQLKVSEAQRSKKRYQTRMKKKYGPQTRVGTTQTQKTRRLAILSASK